MSDYNDDKNEHNEHHEEKKQKHEDGNDDHFSHRFGDVDRTALDPATNDMYFGNGNHPTNYNIADNAKEHVEIGLKVHERGGPDTPYALNSKGDPVFTEHGGLQVATPGKERANWNVDYLADTALLGGHEHLDDYTFKLTVSNGSHAETFDLNSANHTWISESDHTRFFGGDDFNHPATGAVQKTVAENSINIAFGAFSGFGSLATRTGAGQSYDFTMQAFEHNEVIASVHDHVNVIV
jgi:hypothetical protein